MQGVTVFAVRTVSQNALGAWGIDCLVNSRPNAIEIVVLRSLSTSIGHGELNARYSKDLERSSHASAAAPIVFVSHTDNTPSWFGRESDPSPKRFIIWVGHNHNLGAFA